MPNPHRPASGSSEVASASAPVNVLKFPVRTVAFVKLSLDGGAAVESDPGPRTAQPIINQFARALIIHYRQGGSRHELRWKLTRGERRNVSAEFVFEKIPVSQQIHIRFSAHVS